MSHIALARSPSAVSRSTANPFNRRFRSARSRRRISTSNANRRAFCRTDSWGVSPHDARYLRGLAPAFNRKGYGPDQLTSCGLKIHPNTAKTAYPRVADLPAAAG